MLLRLVCEAEQVEKWRSISGTPGGPAHMPRITVWGLQSGGVTIGPRASYDCLPSVNAVQAIDIYTRNDEGLSCVSLEK